MTTNVSPTTPPLPLKTGTHKLAKGIVLGGLTSVIAMEMSNLAFVALRPVVKKGLKYCKVPLPPKEDGSEIPPPPPGGRKEQLYVYDDSQAKVPVVGTVVTKAKAKRKKQKDTWVRVVRLLLLILATYLMVVYVIK